MNTYHIYVESDPDKLLYLSIASSFDEVYNLANQSSYDVSGLVVELVSKNIDLPESLIFSSIVKISINHKQ